MITAFVIYIQSTVIIFACNLCTTLGGKKKIQLTVRYRKVKSVMFTVME